MIFDRFFAPAYKSKDKDKRLLAIANQQDIDDNNRQWLHELAFNDENSEVRLSALNKLNTITLWLKSYENPLDEKIKNSAKEKVLQLLESAEYVSSQFFEELVMQKKYSDLSRQLRANSQRLMANSDLYIDNLLAYGSESEQFQFFKDGASVTQQMTIVGHFKNELKAQKRLKKNTQELAVISAIDANIEHLQSLVKIPVQLEQQSTLINSRLNALLESQNYEFIENSKQALVNEFNAIKSKLTYLPQNKAAAISEKYLNIKASVDKRLANLLPDFERTQEARDFEQQQDALQKQVGGIEEQVNFLLQSHSEEALQTQESLLVNALEDAETGFNELNKSMKESFSTTLQQRQDKILKDIKRLKIRLQDSQQIIKNNQVLQKITEELAKVWTSFEENNLSVETLKEELSFASKSVSELGEYAKEEAKRFETLSNQIKTVLQTLKDKQEALAKRCLNKLNVVINLIQQGKYRAAMATFSAAQEIYESVDSPFAALKRKYSAVSEEIKNLKEWQSYIAAPKKPAILEEVRGLIDDTHIGISERAEKIKRLRSEWNSLGRLDDPDDEALNRSFDEHLEKAFAPCREHYAERDKLRSENAEKAQNLLDKIEALVTLEDDASLLDTFSDLNRQFSKIKSLEHKKRKQLQQRFKLVSAPIQARIDKLYEQRVGVKTRLIKQAKALLEELDLENAAQIAKNLQKEWKAVGHSGRKMDAQLWQTFREINDQLFEKISSHRLATKQAYKNLLDERQVKLDEILNAHNSSTVGDIKHKIEQLALLRISPDELPKAQAEGFNRKLELQIKSLNDALTEAENEKQRTELAELMDALYTWDKENVPKSANLLFRQAFDGELDEHGLFSAFDQRQCLQAVFALSGVAEETSIEIEQDVQLKVMAAKLEGKYEISMAIGFAYWLQAGPPTNECKTLIQENKNWLLQHADKLLGTTSSQA